MCCTAAPLAVCLSILLAEGPAWVDGSISLDAPWNRGPQCAPVTRHTRGTHTGQHKASLEGSWCCELLLQQNPLAWQRQIYVCLHSRAAVSRPSVCSKHRRQRTAPTHSSSCIHTRPPTANSMATQPRLSCGQPTPAALGCVCVFVPPALTSVCLC